MCPEVVKTYSEKTDSQYGQQFAQFLSIKAIHLSLRAGKAFLHLLKTVLQDTFSNRLTGIEPLRKSSRKLLFLGRLYQILLILLVRKMKFELFALIILIIDVSYASMLEGRVRTY